MKIRQMTAADYNQAYRLWLKVPGMNLKSLDNSRSGISRIIARNPETCWVAEDRGRIIGTVLGGTDGRKGFIYHAAVDPDYQKRGVGGSLIRRVCDRFKKQQITKIGLFVVKENDDGKAFWEHQGWNARPDIVYLDRDL
ncbi:MAG: GNAT family N-acetyltransferase [Sporolactobacillus sp.]|jgi:ribosomal protein S18 acetylase RimI-like enzyme|nr:GNAT family N-acetyltransferase [Sporolactobacillus sp.]